MLPGTLVCSISVVKVRCVWILLLWPVVFPTQWSIINGGYFGQNRFQVMVKKEKEREKNSKMKTNYL